MRLFYSSELWEIATGKKSLYKPQNIDSYSLSNLNEKRRIWIEAMLKTVEDWHPEKHGFHFWGKGMVHGAYYTKDEEDSAHLADSGRTGEVKK